MERFWKMIRYFLRVLPACRKLYQEYPFNIMSPEETIDYIIRNKCSVTRFGDGEIGVIFQGRSTGFQDSNEELQKCLLEALCSQSPSLLVCLPLFLSPEKVNGEISFRAKRFWDFWSYDHLKKLYLLLEKQGKKNALFGDTLISRPYIEWKNKKVHADRIFPLLKKIWNDRDILIVEGTETRLGIGNDLFANTKSIRRILAPSENAFRKREDIIRAVEEHYHGELILLALGPAATVLAHDFSKRNMQAIDIGHVDIEYCWYLLNVSRKVAIKGKYTNEVSNGKRNISQCHDEIYRSEVIKIIN